MPVMMSTKCLCVKRKPNDNFSNHKYLSFLPFCVCWFFLFHCCCGKPWWKRSVLGKRTAVNWVLSLGGDYGKCAIVMKSVVGKLCFMMQTTVTLNHRLKRCWGKLSWILPCQQTVLRAKEYSRLFACTEAQQAEGNRGPLVSQFPFPARALFHMLHFLVPWGSFTVVVLA